MVWEKGFSEMVEPLEVYRDENILRTEKDDYNRRCVIHQIIDVMHHQDQTIDDVMISRELVKRGYSVDMHTLKKDICVLNKNNTYVIDIATTNYSAMIENIFEGFQQCIRQCDEIYAKKWTNSKSIRRTVESDDGTTNVIEEVTTMELAGPKTKVTDIKLKCYKYMLNALEGDVINTASGLMLKEFQKLTALKDSLESELENKRRKST